MLDVAGLLLDQFVPLINAHYQHLSTRMIGLHFGFQVVTFGQPVRLFLPMLPISIERAVCKGYGPLNELLEHMV